MQSLSMAATCDVRGGGGNTPLHLLCRGKFEAMIKLLTQCRHFPSATIGDIRRYADENRCNEIAELLLKDCCSTFTLNQANQTALDVLLSDFKQVYNKQLINIDYVRMLNVFLDPRWINERVITALKPAEYCGILQHLALNEDVTNDMHQLLVAFKRLNEHAVKHIVGRFFQLAAKTVSEDKPGNISNWLLALLANIPEPSLQKLFRDAQVKKNLEVLLNAWQRPVAQTVLREFCSWQFFQSGNTILHEVVSQGDVKLISSFLSFSPQMMNAQQNYQLQTPPFFCRDIKTFAMLHASESLDPAQIDAAGQTLLAVFLTNGYFDLAQKLLGLYPDRDLAPSGTTSLLLSAVKGVANNGFSANAIWFLKAAMAHPTSVDLNHRDKSERNALMILFHLMSEDHVIECQSFAKYLISQPEFTTEDVDVDKQNILMHVVHKLSNNPSMVKVCSETFQTLLSKSQGCLDTPDKHGRSLLIYLINELINCTTQEQTQCLEKLAGLIIPKADVNIVDSEDRSALIHAVLNGSEVIVRGLLDKGADVNQLDKSQETAASFAFQLSHNAILNLLLKSPALELNVPDRKGQTLIHKLADSGKGDVLGILLTKREDVNLMHEDQNGDFPVYLAIRNEHCPQTLLKTLIMDSRYKLLALNSREKSVFNILAETGKLETCEFQEDLAQKFSDEMKQETWSDTTLEMARRMEGVQTAQDKCGKTAMMHALMRGVQMTDVKLVSPESVNLKDNLGQSVIHYMLEYKAYHMLLPLLRPNTDCDSDIYARDNSKPSAVLKAILEAPIEIVETFFRHPQFDINFIEEEPTRTTLDLFVDGKKRDTTTEKIFKLFLTKLEEAVTTKGWDAKLVKMFLRVPSCSIDTCDKRHGTALNYAVMTQNMKLALDIMNTCNPDVNHKGVDGNTPLINIVLWLNIEWQEREKKRKSRDEWQEHEKRSKSRDGWTEHEKKSKSRDVDEWSEHEKHPLLTAMLEHKETDVNLSNADWQTPLSLAIDSGNDGLVESLLACTTLGLQLPTFIDQRYRLCEYIISAHSCGLLYALLHHRNFDLNASDWSETNKIETVQDGTSLITLVVKAHWKEGCEIILDRSDLQFDVEDMEGLTPLMHAIKELSADEVRKILKHPNCKVMYTNRWDQTAADRLQKLLDQRKDKTENERIAKMIEKRTKEAQNETNESVPKDERELKAAIEAQIQAYKDRQRDGLWNPREKEEVQSLIHYCVENIMSVGNLDREVKSALEHQRIYIQHYALIVRELDINENVLAVLHSAGVLSAGDCEEIAQISRVRHHKVGMVLRKLMSAGATGYEAFKEAIRSQNQHWLIEEMEKPSPDFPAIFEELERQHVQANITSPARDPVATPGAKDQVQQTPPGFCLQRSPSFSPSVCNAVFDVCSVRETDS